MPASQTTPVPLEAQAFSRYEVCPRLPQLARSLQPPVWPVREAAKRYLTRGLHEVLAGNSAATSEIPQAFLAEGADPGYETRIPVESYDRNAYVLVKDYADWIEGGLQLARELLPASLTPAPVIPLAGGHTVRLAAWQEDEQDGGRIHTVRLTSRAPSDLTEYVSCWNDLLAACLPAAGLPHVTGITVHLFLLPVPVKDRLPSPLCLAYAHPMTGHLRLATFAGEKTAFGPNWRRIARWQTANLGDGEVSWPEWRAGIERDRCLDRCYREVELEVPEERQREAILEDAGRIAGEMAAERLAARRRESCPQCVMQKWCHGDSEEKKSYRPTGWPISGSQSAA